VSVPNVVGLTQAAATTSITSAGLVVGTVTTQSSSTVAAGSVISEAPTAGTSVNTGSAVNLVVSSGPAQVSVPNVVGLTQAAATTSITSAGLVVGTVTTQSSSTVASGTVISEAPTAGTSVNTGSAVNLVVSSGPAQVSVPNVVGLTQAAATTSITSAGLVVGTVTTQSSSTVASGDVISESPTAGTSVNVGSTVNLVVSTGAASNPAVSINLQVLQQILTAGASTTFTDVPVDQNGNPVEQTPTCGITADPTAAGTVPTIASGTFGTAADTRGVYTLTCSLASPALTASATLVVFLPADPTVNTQQATFSAFSGSLNSSESLLQQIQSDLLSGNQTNANEALAQLQSTLNAVSLDELSGSAAFAPEGGFPASAGSLPSFGINPTAADANVGSYLSNLISAIQNLTTFLQTNPLATLTPAQQTQYAQLQSTFSSLVSQLPSPSAYGVAANVDQEDMLFSTVLPQYYQALLQAYIQYLTAEGFTASLKLPSQRGWPGEVGGAQLVHADWNPGNARLLRANLHAFRPGRGVSMQFGGVAEIELVCEIQMDLIKQIYVPYMASIAKAGATIAIAGAFQSWLGGQNLDGVITGADAEIQIFYAAPSAIEGENLNVYPSNNLVYFIGPDQVNGVINLATNVQTWVNSFAKNPPKDLNAANKALQSFKSFYNKQVAYTDCLYNEGLQLPDYTQAPGNCILSFSSSCVELDYNNGFNSVYNPSGPAIPSPVIIITWNVPAGAFSVGTYDFVPATTPNPPGACVNPGSGSLLRKRHDWLFTPRGASSQKGVPGAL
jgi:beta-lactam-binding protein with PASTA domain